MFGYKEELQYEISGLKDEIRELKAENEKLKLRLSDVSNRREQLIAFLREYHTSMLVFAEMPDIETIVDDYLKSNKLLLTYRGLLPFLPALNRRTAAIIFLSFF
jgi:hypothetical protein